jgi:formylglycine-generating enzyme required for sulfatase activity
MTVKLFISYRSTDSVKVDTIVARLNTLKEDDGTSRYFTWQDKKNMPVGQDWWESIVDAIINCDVFVFFISQESLKSEVCKAELAYARKRNRPIIPIVLSDEFYLNERTGKYDITYWPAIPSQLNDMRAQFLFYVGTDFFNEFQNTINLFQKKPQRDIEAPRPLNPDANGESKSNHALYDEACDYAGRLAFAEAEKHFHRLVQRNDPDYGPVAYEWIELLRQYVDLIEVDQRPNARFIFKKKWDAYTALFPKEFLDGIFDPKDFANYGIKTQLDVSAVSTKTDLSGNASTVHTKPPSIDLMPKPFEWIDIPAGKVTLEKGGYLDKDTTFDVTTFQIAKYPITNAQFAKFIEARGYSERHLWTDRGWALHESEKWTEPRYWQDKTWNGPEQPVVGISWFECVAFCQWLSEMSNERIMLPTEQQWQRAAQGDKRLMFPWGNNWDGACCNNSVKPFSNTQTTSVMLYEGKGDSPYHVVDMAGNILEWCLTGHDTGNNEINIKDGGRVLRGGSWDNDNPGNFRSVNRLRYNPSNGRLSIGFRIARIL